MTVNKINHFWTYYTTRFKDLPSFEDLENFHQPAPTIRPPPTIRHDRVL